MEHTQVIIRPVVSEKSYVLSAADRYTFRVHADAHKTEIRQAVEELFDVHVVEASDVGVADIVGAASLLVSEKALEALTARTGQPRSAANGTEAS